MSNEKSKSLSEFSRKAMQRLQDKKVVKHRKLFVPSLNEEITIRNLNYKEIVEITEMDSETDPNRGDKYAIYQAVCTPNLIEVATELKNAGEITEYLEVVDIFDISEVNELAIQIMELSGVSGSKKIKIVGEIKN